ncbi:UNVERIFIED_CONTAM: Pentatricopeptide repeat-containing protein [Sesamum radiatum]|uniref:Pentatricopeptide repeat-containing protein n=1 Tax=Sesamum radiatum TaxID=300843 RepID=A0AAW2P4F4_SESRA
MQLPAPIRAPTFLSRRRLFEQKLADLHKCTDLNQLKQLHALIYKSNLHKDPFVAPKLISALSLCQQMTLAINVFDQIQNPNAFLCNTLIKAYIRNSEPDKAFEVFREMRWSGIFPDNYTYLFLIKACSGLQSVKMIHAHVEKYNLYSDLFVPNSLIDAYSKCGLMGVKAAKVVFDVMEERDVVTYNSMISGLVKAGELTQAKKLFDEMPHRDRVSWNAILDGYVKAGEMSAAFQIFEKMPSRDVVSWSTVISGYAKTGDIEMAKVLFDNMPDKNLVAWTIMISGYAEKGLAKEAARLYDRMEEARLKPDDATFVSILSASAESGLLGLGKKVHQSILRSRYKCGALVSNALIDMYCKCGSLNRAWSIFSAMERKDMVTWNAMIHGLAMHGHGRKALQLFNRMKQEGFAPDKVTFVGVLAACSHAGMVNDGIHHFYSMENDYGIAPEIEHYGCLIDLLGRGGRLSEAFRLLHNMPFEPNVVIWSSLLGACRMHNAVQLAEEVLHQLVKLEPAGPGNFSMLSNIYAAAGDWGSVSNARLQIRNIDSKRPSGVSLIELNDEFHEFTVMDTTHPKSDGIYQTIKGLNQHLTKIPYAPSIAI